MKRCAIYARVSTSDQRVDNQLYDLRLFAEQRGYQVVAEYTDVGISGSKARRPGLDAMLRDARKRKFTVLIVAAFDRIARSTKHFLGVVDELDSLGIEFVSRRENIATDGAMGRLFITLISSIAELEADLIRETCPGQESGDASWKVCRWVAIRWTLTTYQSWPTGSSA